jgi:hypothetical protein
MFWGCNIMPSPSVNNVLRLPQQLMLDSYSKSSNPLALSLRKITSKTTLCIRVRRSNDNAELDIGFASKVLDTNALLTFCGANSGYVVTWYDQSGNGNHVTQATASAQPRIVNNGILERDYSPSNVSALYPTFASASNVDLYLNGNFPNTTGLTAFQSTLSASNNILTITGNGTGNSGYVIKNIGTTVAYRRYYMRATVKVTNSACTAIQMQVGSTGATLIYKISPVQDQTYVLEGISICGSTNSGFIYLQHVYADSATANGKVMEVQEFVVIDVTDMGLPTMFLDSSNDKLVSSQIIPAISNLSTLNSVFRSTISPADSSDKRVVSIGGTTNSFAVNQLSLAYAANTTRNRLYQSVPAVDALSAIKDYNALQNTTVISGTKASTTSMQCFVNGVGGTNQTTACQEFTCDYVGIGITAPNMNISEVIWTIPLSDSQRNKIEKNQGAYYGISVA